MLTDNEIIKAWGKVLTMGDAPIGEHWQVGITTKLAKETFDMLNRQKAENERLKAEAECAEGYADALEERVKSEAYREFAHMVVDKAQKGIIYAMDIPDYVVELTKSNE